jgi:hypothetical protein
MESNFTDVATRPARDLDAVFAAGSPPDIDALVGHEYRGWSLPPALALLGIRKFIKAFDRAGDGRVVGCNTPVRQNGLNAGWHARPSDEQPKRYAFFLVEPADPAADGDRRQAALLDYGYVIRDYLVRVEPGSDDLLLGKAYVVAARRPLWHSYFVLERLGPLRGALPATARSLRRDRAASPR